MLSLILYAHLAKPGISFKNICDKRGNKDHGICDFDYLQSKKGNYYSH